MKTSHLVLIMQCLLLSTVWAQQPPNHFVIGAWGISPDYIEPSMVGADTIHTVWPVVGAWNDLTSPPPPPGLHPLPASPPAPDPGK
jgi:hypothetical protein